MKKLSIVFFLVSLAMCISQSAFAQFYNENGVEIELKNDDFKDITSISNGEVIKIMGVYSADNFDKISASAIYDSEGNLIATIKNGVLTAKDVDVSNSNAPGSIKIPKTFWEQIWYWGFRVILAIVGLLFFFSAFVMTNQKEAKVIQRFGRFVGIRNAGLSMKIPWIDSVAGIVELRIYELNVPVETITKDKVTVNVTASIQMFVEDNREAIQKSFYAFVDDQEQMSSYVFDEVRSQVPKLDLDDVFEKKDQIASAVKEALTNSISEFGFSISNVLVTEIEPDETVAEAMNRINEQKRLRIAEEEEGEEKKILRVKKAQADAESKKLQGEGIANQRKAIASGLKDSLETLKGTGISESEASALMLMTQHYDTLEAVGANSKSNLILLPNAPGAGQYMFTQMLSALKASESNLDNKETEKKEVN